MSDDTYLTIRLSQSSIHVFRNALKVIGTPPYIRFLLNPDTNRIAMIPSIKKDFTSFKVPKGIMDNRDRSSRVRIFSKPLCSAISRQFGWEIARTYRIPGKIYPEQKIVIYYLDEAFHIEKDCWVRPVLEKTIQP